MRQSLLLSPAERIFRRRKNDQFVAFPHRVYGEARRDNTGFGAYASIRVPEGRGGWSTANNGTKNATGARAIIVIRRRRSVAAFQCLNHAFQDLLRQHPFIGA